MLHGGTERSTTTTILDDRAAGSGCRAVPAYHCQCIIKSVCVCHPRTTYPNERIPFTSMIKRQEK